MAAGVWRWAEWLPPIAPAQRISLGEGATPLIEAPRLAEVIGLPTLYLKLDSQNPTGSFKDRGSAVAVSAALAQGATQLVEDSSGNAGASAAAYAARAGLRCTVFAPQSAPAAKLRQAEAYGARVVAVHGNRDEVAAAARRAAREPNVFHLDHNRSDLFVSGVQSLGFELAEELVQVPPVVLPVGGGSMLLGCWLAFRALQRTGALGAMPPLFAVQSEACAPVVVALAKGWEVPTRVEPQQTIAGGIAIAEPPRGAALLQVLRKSSGDAVAVAEAAILRWGALLARLEGIYAEPTSAAAVAGLAQLVAAGTISGKAAIAVITGSGLKDTERSGAAR